MFDFARMSEMVGALLGGAIWEPVAAGSIAGIRERTGIDPANFAGLDQAQSVEVLQQHRVQASPLEGLDIAGLTNAFALSEGLLAVVDRLGRSAQR
jgi:hypothetical protein